jgi:hypothetical protein
MLGYYGKAAIGLPFDANIKAISSFNRLRILMVATPYVFGGRFFLRGNLGLKMRLGGA